MGSNQSVVLSHIDVSLFLSPLPLSLKSENISSGEDFLRMTADPILSLEEHFHKPEMQSQHSHFTDEETEALGFLQVTLGAGEILQDSDWNLV